MRLGSGSGVESTTPTRRHTDRTPGRSTAMAPTLESPPIRIYCVRLGPGETIRVRADTMCEGQRPDFVTTFKREGKIVGKIRGKVGAWWSSPAGAM